MKKILINLIIFAMIVPFIILVIGCNGDDREHNTVDEGDATMYVIRDEDDVRIVTRYNENIDLITHLRKMGGNDVFNISSPMVVPRGENLSDVDLTRATFLNGQGLGESDWFGPYIVLALENIDGTSPGSMHFTGGNHEYTNSGHGGTPTARTDNIVMRINGQRITENFSGYADNIEITWSNYIQATNTKKADGTGREVMREDYTITINLAPLGEHFHFDPKTISLEVENSIEFFEDVRIVTYYGLQAVHNAWNEEVAFSEWAVNYGTPMPVNSLQTGTTDPNADTVALRRGGHSLVMFLDTTYGLGQRQYLNDTPRGEFTNYTIFTATWNKTYFNLINHQEFSAGTIDGWRGTIAFYDDGFAG